MKKSKKGAKKTKRGVVRRSGARSVQQNIGTKNAFEEGTSVVRGEQYANTDGFKMLYERRKLGIVPRSFGGNRGPVAV